VNINKPIARPYQEYMRRRGFDDMRMLDAYNVHYDAKDDRFHGRIIFPVYKHDQCISITGRGPDAQRST
jgi:hypothetical protein